MVINNVELINNFSQSNSSLFKENNNRWRVILFMLFFSISSLSLNAQCMADGGTISTMDDTNICIDGTSDPIDVMIAGASGMNSAWIITDNMNNILALPPAPPFDLDGAGVGICIIWHIQHENDLAGNMIGNNLSDLAGCYGLSNGITVNREIPDGGSVTLTDGSTTYAGCAGDIIFDVMHMTTAANLSYWYIITDNNNNILASHNTADGNTLDLSGAPAGECRIWGWNYKGTTSPVTGEHISSLSDEACEDVTESYISVFREVADGGSVTLTDGSTTYAGCAGDIIFDVMHMTTAANLSYWYIITDSNNNILASHNTADGNTLDLGGAPAGECRIWGWNYKGTTSPVTGEHISSLSDEACEDVTESYISVFREVADGGSVTLTDGSTTYAGCAGDIIFDVMHMTTAPNLSYWYIITDNNNNILASHNTADGNTLDLSGAPAGECRIWGWNYKGTTSPVTSEHISSLSDEACEDVTASYITVNRMDCSEECMPVGNIQHNLMAPASCHITWDASPNQTKWDVHYRKQGTTAWTRVGALNPEKTLRSLEANTVYQYIVRPYCGTWDFALASPIRRFNTANIPAPEARVQKGTNDIISLSPNPTRNLLRVEFSTEMQSDVNLSVMDLTGKIIQLITISNVDNTQTETIDVSNLAQGYYLLVMQTGNDRIVKKFAKIQ